MTFRLVISGQPAPKKTSNRVVRTRKAGVSRLFIIPGEKHQAWFGPAMAQAKLAWHAAGNSLPMSEPVQVTATFYRETRHRVDLLNLEQALADLLERAGIVANDHLIRSWDGSRMVLGANAPRIEVAITDEWEPTYYWTPEST